MASIVIEVELSAAFPDSTAFITSRQFRHDSIYYTRTVWPLAMKAIMGFWMSGTNHLRFSVAARTTCIYTVSTLRHTEPKYLVLNTSQWCHTCNWTDQQAEVMSLAVCFFQMPLTKRKFFRVGQVNRSKHHPLHSGQVLSAISGNDQVLSAMAGNE